VSTTTKTFRHRLLQCRLRSVSFPDDITCRLLLEEGHCTDMGGAIKVAKSVTKHLEGFELRVIRTDDGAGNETVYRVANNGGWRASW
jgi:hypothetical protein